MSLEHLLGMTQPLERRRANIGRRTSRSDVADSAVDDLEPIASRNAASQVVFPKNIEADSLELAQVTRPVVGEQTSSRVIWQVWRQRSIDSSRWIIALWVLTPTEN